MTAAGTVLLLGAGAVAGIVGSAGGTASLISYPALLAVGIPPLAANVTNAVAFVAAWPGSALGSRPELRGQGPSLRRWAPLAVAGSAAGATLLLVTPAGAFDRVVPFLLAFAALALLLQPKVSAWLAGHPASSSRRLLLPAGLIAASAYDGYWGAGAGVMTLALLMITTGDQHGHDGPVPSYRASSSQRLQQDGHDQDRDGQTQHCDEPGIRGKQFALLASPAPRGGCRNTGFSMIILDHGTKSSRAASTSKAH
jgi:hypothetical protein